MIGAGLGSWGFGYTKGHWVCPFNCPQAPRGLRSRLVAGPCFHEAFRPLESCVHQSAIGQSHRALVL